jgi:hypothetical protein
MRYLVERLEIWSQPVWVEAPTAAEAVIKAEQGDCEIHSDPKWVEDFCERPWLVEDKETPPEVIAIHVS